MKVWAVTITVLVEAEDEAAADDFIQDAIGDHELDDVRPG